MHDLPTPDAARLALSRRVRRSPDALHVLATPEELAALLLEALYIQARPLSAAETYRSAYPPEHVSLYNSRRQNDHAAATAAAQGVLTTLLANGHVTLNGERWDAAAAAAQRQAGALREAVLSRCEEEEAVCQAPHTSGHVVTLREWNALRGVSHAQGLDWARRGLLPGAYLSPPEAADGTWLLPADTTAP